MAVVDSGLFEKTAFSQRSLASVRPTGSSSPRPETEADASSPLAGFMARLFPSGAFLDKLAIAEQADGTKRASYYTGRGSSSIDHEANDTPKKRFAPSRQAKVLSENKRQAVIEKRLAAEREVVDAQRSDKERAANKAAASLIDARRQRTGSRSERA